MLKHTKQDINQVLNDSSTTKISKIHKKLIEKYDLTYHHHNDDSIFLEAPAKQEGRTLAKDARYWYRAMTPDEFHRVYKDNQAPENDSFGGIATNRAYSRKYITNDSSAQYLVEFDLGDIDGNPGLLFNEFSKLGINIKAEGDGGSYGLGETGTKVKGVDPREIFNYHLVRWRHVNLWRLVNLRIPNNVP